MSPSQQQQQQPEQLVLLGGLGGPGVDMSKLRAGLVRLSLGARAAATRRAYESDWRDFAGWCQAAGRMALPAVEETVALYVVQLLGERTVSTVERRLAAIAHRHRSLGQVPPIGATVRELLRAARREKPAARGKRALTVAQLVEASAAAPATAAGVRDRALLVVGFASGLRRSELAALDLADVEVLREGVRIHVARSKTDQAGLGRDLGLFAGTRIATCPVRTLRAWLKLRGHEPGPLWWRTKRGGKDLVRGGRLSAEGVGDVVKRAVARIGLDTARYAGHSLRAGMVTAAAERGAAESLIMQRSGHRSHQVMSRYVRSASVFAADPLAGAL